MDLKLLRQHAQRSRAQAVEEKLLLVQTVVTARAAMAEDQLGQCVHRARHELQERTLRAAGRGQERTVLLVLSAQLYDLVQAVSEELGRSAQRTPDPYPQLRRGGPYRYSEVDRWVRYELGWPDPDRASPLVWLDELGRWVQSQSSLSRILKGGPPLHGELKQLYADCKERRLKPAFEFYERFEDQGLQLLVTWSGP